MNESDLRSDVHYLGSSENKARIFFRPYFHYCLSSAHHCEDHFHSSFRNMGYCGSYESEIIDVYFWIHDRQVPL